MVGMVGVTVKQRGQASSKGAAEWELASADWCNTGMWAFSREARNLDCYEKHPVLLVGPN